MNLHVQSHIVSATEALRHLAGRKPPTVAEAGLHGVSSDAIHFQYDLKRDVYHLFSLQRLLSPPNSAVFGDRPRHG